MVEDQMMGSLCNNRIWVFKDLLFSFSHFFFFATLGSSKALLAEVDGLLSLFYVSIRASLTQHFMFGQVYTT